MPRLRIAVRVITEDAYIESLPQGPPGPPLYRGEKKFAVIISNPEQWSVGHLGVEIEKQYMKTYRCDIGRIKRLVTHDNCELHDELNVWEYLADVDRAQYEYGDQHITLKAVQEHGRAIKEDSVVPDFTNPIYQHPPRPPVPTPTWSDRPSHPAKRPATSPFEQYRSVDAGPSFKRQRLNDINEAQDEEDIAHSVERDGIEEDARGSDGREEASPELIEDSQSSPKQRPQLRPRGSTEEFSGDNLPLFKGKQATVPLKITSAKPVARSQSFVEKYKGSRPVQADIVDNKASVSRPGLGPLNTLKRISPKQLEDGSRALITPDSDASKIGSTTGQKSPVSIGTKKKGSNIQERPSGVGKFKSVKRNVYDLPESEIEDSQLSPRAKMSNRLHTSKFNTPQRLPRARTSEKNGLHGLVGLQEVTRLMDDSAITFEESTKRPRNEVKSDWSESCSEVYSGRSIVGDEFEVENARIATKESTDDFATPPASAEDMRNMGRSTSMRSMGSTYNPQTESALFQHENQNNLRDRRASVTSFTTSTRRKRKKKKSGIPDSQGGGFGDEVDLGDGNTVITTLSAADGNEESYLALEIPGSKTIPHDGVAIDSPSEQLLEMQASSQTDLPGGLKTSKSASSKAKKTKTNVKKSEKTNSKQKPATKESKDAKDSGSMEKVPQAQSKKKAEKKLKAEDASKRADTPDLFNRTCSSRINAVIDVLNDSDGIVTGEMVEQNKAQPVEGRMGLGISPRKNRRTPSFSGGAFQVQPNESAIQAGRSKESIQPVKRSSKSAFLLKVMSSKAAPVYDNSADAEHFLNGHESDRKSVPGSEEEGDIEYSPSLNKEQSKKKSEPKEKTEANSNTLSPPALKGANGIVIPMGMTAEQYEAHKKSFEGVHVVPKKKRSNTKPETWDEIQSRVSGSLPQIGNDGSASGSVSEGPKVGRGAEKKELSLKEKLAKEKVAQEVRSADLVLPKVSALTSYDQKQVVTSDNPSNGVSISKAEKTPRAAPKAVKKTAAPTMSTSKPTSSVKATPVALSNSMSKRPVLKDVKQMMGVGSAGSSTSPFPGRQASTKSVVSESLNTFQTSSEDDESSEEESGDEDEFLKKNAKKSIPKPDPAIRDVSESEESEGSDE